MFHDPDTIRCDGCGAEILLAPVVEGERKYCCEECAQGRPCLCAEQQERNDERRAQVATGPSGLSLQG